MRPSVATNDRSGADNNEDYRGMSAANGVDSSDSLCSPQTQKGNELE